MGSIRMWNRSYPEKVKQAHQRLADKTLSIFFRVHLDSEEDTDLLAYLNWRKADGESLPATAKRILLELSKEH